MGKVREQTRHAEAPRDEGFLGLKGQKEEGNDLLGGGRAGPWQLVQQEPLLWRLAATIRAVTETRREG